MVDQPVQRDHGTSESRMKGTSSVGGGKRASMEAAMGTTTINSNASSNVVGSAGGGGGAAPYGVFKFLRRKCIFAPHFGSDQGAAHFAAVHKVVGASNVISKLLLHIPLNRRHDAVVTISYEAQARLSDPVYGCVSTILALQQQVASLQAELAMVQTQLMNSRFAFANALQITSQQQQQQHDQQQQQNVALILQPPCSNNSSASTNLINMSSFPSNFDIEAAPSSQSFMEPLQISRPSQDDEDDEEESRVPLLFANDRY